MTRPTRFLVLTLHSGENEFEACRDSVAAQTDVDVTQDIISGYSNIEAHRILYRKVMEQAGNYDLFMKLDADMVLKRPSALAEIACFFKKRPSLDQLVVKVDDHYTGTPIFGVHTFSPRVSWRLDSSETLFADPDPEFEGGLIRDPQEIPIFVDHAPNPSGYQAFYFGFHRMLKVLQNGQSVKYTAHTAYQAAILRRLETQYLTKGPANLGLAVLAAELVRTGHLSATTSDRDDTAVRRAFDMVSALSDDEVRRRIKKTSLRRRLHYIRVLQTIRLQEHVHKLRAAFRGAT